MENAFNQPQNVVVLGGTSDIARALTKKLCAARTRRVVLAGRSQSLLDECTREAEEYGASATATVLFDAEEPANARRVVSDAFELVGGAVDLVVVAVGLLGDQSEDQDDATAAARMMTVNVTWPVAALAEVRRRLVAQGSGRVVVLSSVAAVRVRANSYLYSGAKAGLDRLCVGLAHSLRGTGVTLHIVRPAVVRTKMTAGIVAEPPFTTGANEVADTILAGLARGDEVIWSPPIVRYVFALLRHLPYPLWRAVVER